MYARCGYVSDRQPKCEAPAVAWTGQHLVCEAHAMVCKIEGWVNRDNALLLAMQRFPWLVVSQQGVTR